MSDLEGEREISKEDDDVGLLIKQATSKHHK